MATFILFAVALTLLTTIVVYTYVLAPLIEEQSKMYKDIVVTYHDSSEKRTPSSPPVHRQQNSDSPSDGGQDGLSKCRKVLPENQTVKDLQINPRFSPNSSKKDVWSICIERAMKNIKDLDKVKEAFSVAKNILSDPRTAYKRDPIMKTLYNLIQARTRYSVRTQQGDSASNDYVPSFETAPLKVLHDLCSLYETLILLHSKMARRFLGATTDFPQIVANIVRKTLNKEDVKDFIYVMLIFDSARAYFRQDLVAEWSTILGDGDQGKAKFHVLQKCHRLIALGNWKAAQSYYNIYHRFCSSNVAEMEPSIGFKIYVGLALEDIEDGSRVRQVFDFAKFVVSKEIPREEKEEYLQSIFDVLSVRAQFLVAFDVAENEQKIEGAIQAAKEIPSICKTFLDVCVASNLGGPHYHNNESRLGAVMTPIKDTVIEKLHKDGSYEAKTIAKTFVTEMEPFVFDLML